MLFYTLTLGLRLAALFLKCSIPGLPSSEFRSQLNVIFPDHPYEQTFTQLCIFSFCFFSQSSHHSPKWSGLLLCFLAGYLSPHTRMSALHGPGPVLLMLPLWGQKTVPGTLKTLSFFFFCYIGGGINNFIWVLWSCKVVFIFVFGMR